MSKCLGFIVCVCVATSTCVGCITCRCTCRSGYYCVVFVSNISIFTTYITISITVIVILMTKCRFKLCATNCTILCRCTGCIGTCLVTESCDCFLRNEDFVTYRAMLTCGKTCLCTCRSYCRIGYFGMTESCDCFLCNEDFVTY